MPTRISAPAAARAFAIAQPYPLSSATPAINALLPTKKKKQQLVLVNGMFETRKCTKAIWNEKLTFQINWQP